MAPARDVTDHHNENEQIAFGPGVQVDGPDFSDDRCWWAARSATAIPGVTESGPTIRS